VENHVKQNSGNETPNPLFLYLAYTAGHTPLLTEPEWREKCGHVKHEMRKDFCGLVVGVDEGIKNVTLAARELLGDNAIIIFTSDNGGMLHVGGLNTPLRGGKNTGWEGGVRTIGFITDLTSEHKHLPSGKTFHGLMHAADWMPTVLGIVDSANSGPPYVREDHIGNGFDLHEALKKEGDESPRTDAVLVLDEFSNFVSYLRPPYKILVGHRGDSSWSTEPQGRYLYGEATDALDMFEEELSWVLDKVFGSRDISFFWHEVVHIVVNNIKQFFRGGRDFYAAGKKLLGPKESGNVLASEVLSWNEIPIALFDVYSDPTETTDLAEKNPEIVSKMIKEFNKHWADRPEMYDWGLACRVKNRRWHVPENNICEARVSDQFPEPFRKSVPKNIPCKFEGPFVDDSDPRPCGALGDPFDIKAEFLGIVVRGFVGILLGLVVVLVTTLVACRRFRK
jgi:hypothetical protein